MLQELSKIVIIFGIILVGVGLLLAFLHKVPLVGKLPGDIIVQKKNLTFYFPVTSSMLISIALSFLSWLCSRK